MSDSILIDKQEASPSGQQFRKPTSYSSIKTSGSLENDTHFPRRRLPEQLKRKLLHLITRENYNMKEASKTLNLSYSTVKKIYTRFRKNIKNLPKSCKPRHSRQARFTQLETGKEGDGPRVVIISTIGGKQQTRSQNTSLIASDIC